MLTKEEVRRTVRARLSALTKEEKEVRDRAIASRFCSSEEFLSARSLFLYRSTSREAGTEEILCRALAEDKQVFLPRVEGEEMILVPYRSGDPLAVGVFGIEEPIGKGAKVTPDLAVIPLLAFDRRLSRLGKGKGYYDRFLATYGGRCVALAYADQEVEEVPAEPHDRSPQKIFTDKECIE